MPPERQAVLFLHTLQVATEAEEQRVAKEAEVLREAEKLFCLSFCRETFVSLPTCLRVAFGGLEVHDQRQRRRQQWQQRLRNCLTWG